MADDEPTARSGVVERRNLRVPRRDADGGVRSGRPRRGDVDGGGERAPVATGGDRGVRRPAARRAGPAVGARTSADRLQREPPAGPEAPGGLPVPGGDRRRRARSTARGHGPRFQGDARAGRHLPAPGFRPGGNAVRGGRAAGGGRRRACGPARRGVCRAIARSGNGDDSRESCRGRLGSPLEPRAADHPRHRARRGHGCRRSLRDGERPRRSPHGPRPDDRVRHRRADRVRRRRRYGSRGLRARLPTDPARRADRDGHRRWGDEADAGQRDHDHQCRRPQGKGRESERGRAAASQSPRGHRAPKQRNAGGGGQHPRPGRQLAQRRLPRARDLRGRRACQFEPGGDLSQQLPAAESGHGGGRGPDRVRAGRDQPR